MRRRCLRSLCALGPPVVLGLLAVLVACGPPSPTAAAEPVWADSTGEYIVGGTLAEVYGAERVLVNGFPLHITTGPGSMIAPGTGLGTPMTPALVSGRNEAAVEVVPAVFGSAAGLEVGPVRFQMWVEAPDGSVVPGTERGLAHVDSVVTAWGADLAARWGRWGPAALDSARTWAQGHPVRVAVSFERPGGARPTDGAPSFDGVFREAPVIRGTPADSARLRAYAAELGALMARRDTAALWAAFEGRYADEFVWWGGAEAVGEDSAAAVAGARGRLVFERPVPFGAADVRLRSWSGGRVWEAYRDGARGLLEPGDRSTWQPVYVGEGPDGRLRVVR